MNIPLEITFRGVQASEEIKELIGQKADKLDRIGDNLISCRVAVEKKQKHQQSGAPYRVRVNMRLPPGQELVVDSGEGGDGSPNDDLPGVIRGVFESALRQVKKLNERRQDDVKEHPAQETSAVVVRLFAENGYGFLKSAAGREVFFHRNSVVNDDFDRLEVGTGVRFVEVAGEEGPQASTVQIVDKPGVRAPKTDGDAVAPPLGWRE